MRKMGSQYPREFNPPGVLDVNQQDYASQITAALGLQSRVPAHLDSNIQVGLTLDDFTRPEFAWLRKLNRWTSYHGQPGIAGQRASMQLVPTPPVYPVLIVIHRMTICNANAAAQAINYGWKQIEAGVPASYATMDLRLGGNAVPFCSFGRMTNAAPALVRAGGLVFVAAGGSATVELDWVMNSPGNVGSGECFGIVNQAVLQSLDVTLEWSERAILPSERNPSL